MLLFYECGLRLPSDQGSLVGFQNSATGLDLGFYAARSYSLMRPPRTGRRLIRSLGEVGDGVVGPGGGGGAGGCDGGVVGCRGLVL